MARGKRPAPFRTRKLSLSAPMVLQVGTCGRVGRRRTYKHPRGAIMVSRGGVVRVHLLSVLCVHQREARGLGAWWAEPSPTKADAPGKQGVSPGIKRGRGQTDPAPASRHELPGWAGQARKHHECSGAQSGIVRACGAREDDRTAPAPPQDSETGQLEKRRPIRARGVHDGIGARRAAPCPDDAIVRRARARVRPAGLLPVARRKVLRPAHAFGVRSGMKLRTETQSLAVLARCGKATGQPGAEQGRCLAGP